MDKDICSGSSSGSEKKEKNILQHKNWANCESASVAIIACVKVLT